MDTLTSRVRARAHAAGFDVVGVAPAQRAPLATLLRAWLDRGMHGTMQYMEDPDGRREDPGVYLPWARSLVIVALDYHTPYTLSLEPDHGAISRYAWGSDYHTIVRTRLHEVRQALAELVPGCRAHVFVDTSPVLEKGVAEAAGLGWRGKHTNLLRKRHGSWFFLGGLATDVALEYDHPGRDHCGTCTRCITACPTRAIVAPYVLDARLCISYLTIELRGPIPRPLRPLIGNRIFGCDDCQDVCPWNRFAQSTRIAAFAPRAGNLNPLLVDLMALTKSEWNRRFKKTPVRRAHYAGFLRNVAVALGNWGAPAALPALRARLDDPQALVRGHVAWAIGRIAAGCSAPASGGAAPGALGATVDSQSTRDAQPTRDAALAALHARLAVEYDAWVREEIVIALECAGS